jgi:hypothetical protein
MPLVLHCARLRCIVVASIREPPSYVRCSYARYSDHKAKSVPLSGYAVYLLFGPPYIPASQMKKEVGSGSLILI